MPHDGGDLGCLYCNNDQVRPRFNLGQATVSGQPLNFTPPGVDRVDLAGVIVALQQLDHFTARLLRISRSTNHGNPLWPEETF